MDLTPNDGDRPSLLALGRLASGELPEAEAEALRASLDDAARQTLADIEAARPQVAPFDAAALRQRAAGSPALATPPPTPTPANRTWLVATVAFAAMLLLGLAVVLQPAVGPEPRNEVRFRSSDTVQLHVLEGRTLVPWRSGPLAGGDTVGFQVAATGHDRVVLLSVTDAGDVQVLWPEAGEAGEPLQGDGLVGLPGSLVLDDHEGREAFVALFDHDVPLAEKKVRQAFELGHGLDGVLRWVGDTEGVDAVAVERAAALP